MGKFITPKRLETFWATAVNKLTEGINGKKLSSNDLTDELKEKYDKAESNKIDSISVNGEKQTIDTDKNVNIEFDAGTGIQDITQEEYDALSEEEKMGDTIYHITDAEDDNAVVNVMLGETSETAYAGDKGKALADKIGDTDISTIGDGTVTGAISEFNSKSNYNANSNIFKIENPKYTGIEAYPNYGAENYTITDDVFAGVQYGGYAWDLETNVGEIYTIFLTNAKNKKIFADESITSEEGISTLTFTAKKTITKIGVLYGYNGNNQSETKIQINVGSDIKPYEKYSGKNNLQLSDDVSSIELEAVELKMLGWTVPREMPLKNTVSGNKFIQRVGRIDLGNLNYTLHPTYVCFYETIKDGKSTKSINGSTNAYCSKYTLYSGSFKTQADKTLGTGYAFRTGSSCEVLIKDSSYTDTTSFKNAMKGVYLYYELDTPVEMRIDGNEVLSVLSYNNSGTHNSIYRGKFLGSSLTDTQKTAIKNGTFEDLWVGDYWVIDGVTWRIAHFDYWLNTGDTACTAHHAIIVPDACLYNAKMNDTNITTGAYVGSAMYTANLAAAKTTIENAFGSANILTHREFLANATNATGDPAFESAGSWCDSTVELMNECMVYGSNILHNVEANGVIPYSYTIDKTQLALFRLDPSKICNRASWWLRDVVSSAYFAFVYSGGNANAHSASYAYGVRPAFGIC